MAIECYRGAGSDLGWPGTAGMPWDGHIGWWWNAVADFGYVCPLLSSGGKLASRIFCISTMQQVLMEVKLSSSLIWAWPSSAPACSTFFFTLLFQATFFLKQIFFLFSRCLVFFSQFVDYPSLWLTPCHTSISKSLVCFGGVLDVDATCVNQSQILGLGLSLEFDKIRSCL